MIVKSLLLFSIFHLIFILNAFLLIVINEYTIIIKINILEKKKNINYSNCMIADKNIELNFEDKEVVVIVNEKNEVIGKEYRKKMRE